MPKFDATFSSPITSIILLGGAEEKKKSWSDFMFPTEAGKTPYLCVNLMNTTAPRCGHSRLGHPGKVSAENTSNSAPHRTFCETRLCP